MLHLLGTRRQQETSLKEGYLDLLSHALEVGQTVGTHLCDDFRQQFRKALQLRRAAHDVGIGSDRCLD